MYAKEENNYPKALGISAVIMALLIALSFIIVIGSFKPEEKFGTGGMVVNWGTSATGIGSDYTSIEDPSMAPDANNKQPDKVVPDQKIKPNTSSAVDAKEVQTQDKEETITLNTKNAKPTNTPSPTTENKPEKPAINPNALYKGNKNNGTGKGDGTGTDPGNQGSPNGDPMAPNYGDGGSGLGDTPIPLRRFTNLVIPKDDGQKTGKVAVRISINKNGVVVSALPGVKGSTILDKDLLEKCRQAVMGATFNKSSEGPELQSGVVIFNFKVQ